MEHRLLFILIAVMLAVEGGPRGWAGDPRMEERVLNILEAVGLGACELPRFRSEDIGHADVLRQHGSAALVTLADDANGASLSDRAAFLSDKEFGQVDITPQDSFLFSHFGGKLADQLPTPQFDWRLRQRMREWVDRWSVLNASSTPPENVFGGSIGTTNMLEELGRFRERWLLELGQQRQPSDFVFSESSLLSLGASGSGLTFHAHWESWVAQFVGSKLWFLFPPKRVPSEPTLSRLMLSPPHQWLADIPSLPPASRPMLCLQRERELVWLPDFWMHATLNIGDSLGFGGQLFPTRVKRRQALDALLQEEPLSYFAASTVFQNLPKSATRESRLKSIEEALRISPLHMSTRLLAIEYARAQGEWGAKKAAKLLLDGVDALDVQVNAYMLQNASVARCIAMLAWKAAALVENGQASLRGATMDLINAARRAALRALELKEDERMAQTLLKLLEPPADAKASPIGTSEEIVVDASGTVARRRTSSAARRRHKKLKR